MSEPFELAGDKIRLVDNPDGTRNLVYSDKGTGRVCGQCQACCRLVPVPEIDKPANHRCRHQSYAKGCTIYARRPVSCRAFGCRWLIDDTTAHLPRPDRAHYVIDPNPDYVTANDVEHGVQQIPVIQIWCDPAHPHAHRAPALRAWLEDQAARFNCAAIVRYDNIRAVTLIPPQFMVDHQWHEVDDTQMTREER